MDRETRKNMKEWQRINLLEGMVELSEADLGFGCWKQSPNKNKLSSNLKIYFSNNTSIPKHQVIGGGWGMYLGHIKRDDRQMINPDSHVTPLQKKTINGKEMMVVGDDPNNNTLVLEREFHYQDLS